MYTKSIKTLPISAAKFKAFKQARLKEMIAKKAGEIAQEFAGLTAEFEERLNAHEWVFLINKDDPGNTDKEVYYIPEIVGLMPNLEKRACDKQYGNGGYNTDLLTRLDFANFKGDLPTEKEARACFNRTERTRYCFDSSGYIVVRNESRYGCSFKKKNGYWCLYTHSNSAYQNGSWKHGNGTSDYYWTIPIHRFAEENSEPVSAAQALIYWVANDLQPDMADGFKSKASKAAFQKLQELYKKYPEFLVSDGQKLTINQEKVFDACMKDSAPDFLPNAAALVKATEVEDEDFTSELIKELLECDKNRVMLDVYDENLLTEQNRGHWDLWDYGADDGDASCAAEEGGKAILTKELVARNPAADVNLSGIVAIDFGTKTTVVAYEDEGSKINLLQVGSGDYSKGTLADNFENPTILEFIHLNKFREDYKARAGRPRTSWSDVVASRAALDDLKLSSSSRFYTSFFANIKRWCGGSGAVRITDQGEESIDLPPFDELTEADLNPVEIYAYYLGSYINHMLQTKHIFMRYVMSFPVQYEMGLKERMRSSFEAGLKKSLPTALLSNEEAMKDFQVVAGASEPAAYAITALTSYGFESDNKPVYYAVFDFGGGTTDFDYGLFRPLDDDRYSSELIHFGAYGDNNLGGENLLDLMAFHVFRANEARLLAPDNLPKDENSKEKKGKITFTWPADKVSFPNSEKLISESQESHLNMYNLREKLRPIWEKPDSEDTRKMLESASVKVNLFLSDGTPVTSYELSLLEQPEEAQKEERDFGTIVVEDYLSVDDYVKKLFDAIGDAEKAQPIVAGIMVQGKANDDIKLAVAKEIQRAEHEKSMSSEDKAKSKTKKILDLNQILKDRIAQGIDNFFIAMREAFNKRGEDKESDIAHLSDVGEVAIFLAGNSSRSSLVKELFDEYTKTGGRAYDLLGFGKEKNMPRFVLYPPLGTTEAHALQKEKSITPQTDIDAPTGKTGVAYGLLLSRDGGEIKVTQITPDGEKTLFRYFVGRSRRKIFKPIMDYHTNLGTWHRFIDAKEKTFDLYYTDQAVAATGNEPITVAKRLTLSIDDVSADKFVFIRAADSGSIEYAVGKEEDELEEANKVKIALD